MFQNLPIVCSALALVSLASATGLNLSVQAGGSNTVVVGPGEHVNYSVVGELSDHASLGLAMFSFDLSYSGGALAQARAPLSDPMKRFAVPEGLNNPAGFGGTQASGMLRQVGGAQNTIRNTSAPVPIGLVLTDVGQPGSPVVLAQGGLSAPNAVGDFTLSARSLFANVIRQGETGQPFWRVDPCAAGGVQNLTIEVRAIQTSTGVVSVSAHQSQSLQLNAGAANAGRTYLLLGSLSGTSPGLILGNGLVLPLDPDSYLRFTRSHPNSAILAQSLGVLDAHGRASATFTPDASFQNKTANHAFILLGPVNFVSEAESCQVVP